MSTIHSKAAHEVLKDKDKITRHDQTFWGLRMGHDKMASQLPEWEDLREHASQIKKHTITHLADYLEQFSTQLESRGSSFTGRKTPKSSTRRSTPSSTTIR